MSSLPPNATNLAPNLPQEVYHKFLYPEFDGPQGYTHLNGVLRTILPLSLHRTWQILTQVQKDHKSPYAGISYLVEASGRTDRKMQMDLARFEQMNLMRRTAGVEMISGQVRRVEYKDFTNLYHLAHEYHDWVRTNTYQLYQPIYEDAQRIREHPELYHFLIRFENYRRILTYPKPGPKRTHFETPRYSNESSSEECITSNSDVDLQKTKSKPSGSSPYESNNSIKKDSEDSNGPQNGTSFFLKDSPLGTDLPKNDRVNKATSNHTGNKSIEIPAPQRLENIPQAQQLKGQVTAQDKARAYIDGVVAEEKRKKAAGTPKERYNKFAESQALIDKHTAIVNTCCCIAEELNDMGGRSTLVDICRLYETSKRPVDNFIAIMDYARYKAKQVGGSQIKVRTLDGRPNRMPLFMSIIRKAVKDGLEALELFEKDRQFREAKEQAYQSRSQHNGCASTQEDPYGLALPEWEDALESPQDAILTERIPNAGDDQDSVAAPSDDSALQLSADCIRSLSEPASVIADDRTCAHFDIQRSEYSNSQKVGDLPIQQSDALDTQISNALDVQQLSNQDTQLVDDLASGMPHQEANASAAPVVVPSPPLAYKRAIKHAIKCAHQLLYALLKTVQGIVRLFTDLKRPCQNCGCPTMIVERAQTGQDLLFCVSCDPAPFWPDEVVEQVRQIVGDLVAAANVAYANRIASYEDSQQSKHLDVQVSKDQNIQISSGSAVQRVEDPNAQRPAPRSDFSPIGGILGTMSVPTQAGDDDRRQAMAAYLEALNRKVVQDEQLRARWRDE